MEDRWLIRFESGAFLSKTERRITYFGNTALTFKTHEEAEEYFMKNFRDLEQTGLRPSLAKAGSNSP